jgi:hypothetical protein
VQRAREGDRAFEALQSEYWGLPVTLRFLPRRVRREGFANHYLAGISRVEEQPLIQSFAGAGAGARGGRADG